MWRVNAGIAQEEANIRALDRVLAILEAVVAANGEATMSDVSSRTSLNLATVSRLLRDMADAGLVARQEATGTYRLGPRLVAMVGASSRQGSLLDLALPVMKELRDASLETVSLHLRIGAHRVCVAQIESPQEVRRVVTVGLSLPLQTGATGQALLAYLPEADQAAYLEHLEPDVRGPLAAQLADIRRKGYACAANAWIEGVAGVAAPIRDSLGAIGVLSVSGPSFRWTEARMTAFAPTVMAATDVISRAL